MSSLFNANYFLSEKIKVFPCAYRNSTYDATARLNTEYNFTHLPHMVDKASYIIKFNDIPENETTTKLICVIQGYYFEIELGDDDYATLQNKYLNICLASPNGAGSIESPHLCSWDSSDGVEATLDGKPEGSDYYIFKGLKIGEGALSNGSYQCYALKLDASAKLPISANKIENSAGIPISSEFTTGTLSATTSTNTPSLNVANGKLIVNSSSITANVPVTISGGSGNLKVAGTGEFGGKLTVKGKPTGPNDAVRKQELDNTLWLSGGVLIQSKTNLNTLTTVGNYYYPSDGRNIANVPLGTSGPFTLKVSSVPNGSNFLIQQQFTQCINGNTYTRVRKTDGNWESIGSALGSYGSGWSVAYNTTTAAIINFTRREAINSGCKESEDGKHKIMVPVKALIQCAMNHYSTRACLRVGGTGGTFETNHLYFGIQIEGLPVMDDFLVHIDIKSYNSDAWITLEHPNKTYQCFYNSNYYAPTIDGEPNLNYDARPMWVYVPSSGDRDARVKYKEDADGNKTYTDDKGNTFNTIPIPTGNIGLASQPVYLAGGELTPCTYATVVGGSLPDKPDANTLYFITEN